MLAVKMQAPLGIALDEVVKPPLRGIELKGDILFFFFELLIGHAPAFAGKLPESLLPPLQTVLLQLIAALSLAIHLSLRDRGGRRRHSYACAASNRSRLHGNCAGP